MSQQKPIQVIRCLCAAAAGGAIGYWGFFQAASQGLYAMILPGGLIGIGATIWPVRGAWMSVLCGIAAFALGVVTEWRFRPFVADDSLAYFVAHLHQLSTMTGIMVGLGALLGFMLPWRHRNDPGSV